MVCLQASSLERCEQAAAASRSMSTDHNYGWRRMSNSNLHVFMPKRFKGNARKQQLELRSEPEFPGAQKV